MSRSLGDDFDEDDLPGGSLDLDKGSHSGAGGVGGASTSYDSGGMDFDDDPYGEGAGGRSFELDLPQGSATAMRSAVPDPRPPGPRSAPPGGPAVPELVVAPPARTSGAHPVRPSSQSSMRAVGWAPQRATLSAPPSSQREHGEQAHDGDGPSQALPSGGAPPPAPAPAKAPPGPARPTAAAIIAKYPEAPPQIWQAPKYAIQVLLRQFQLRSELESLRRRRSPDVPLYEAALRAHDPKTFQLGVALNVAILAIAMFVFFLPVILRFMRAD